MPGSDPCISASRALSARLMQAELPPLAYAPVSTARDGFRSRCGVIEPAPTAQQPDVVGHLSSSSSPGTDRQLRSLIADAMRQLPFEHRAVIYRAYYQGWTTGRIAADLKITEATVKSRLHDGLRTLRLTFH
jgi:DNA-directed RNA polymerase specialized sigma24 family protein